TFSLLLKDRVNAAVHPILWPHTGVTRLLFIAFNRHDHKRFSQPLSQTRRKAPMLSMHVGKPSFLWREIETRIRLKENSFCSLCQRLQLRRDQIGLKTPPRT